MYIVFTMTFREILQIINSVKTGVFKFVVLCFCVEYIRYDSVFKAVKMTINTKQRDINECTPRQVRHHPTGLFPVNTLKISPQEIWQSNNISYGVSPSCFSFEHIYALYVVILTICDRMPLFDHNTKKMLDQKKKSL